MRKLARRLVLFCLVVFAPGAPADTLKETWYLMRSRANMQIGNYAAAIEAYEKYLELQPDDREALKGIAIAYERQGQTDKAIARFDTYLSKYPDDYEVAFKQADYLTWSRYAYRKDDAVRYLRSGLALHDDPEQRLKYARLLAADKYDLDESVAQYQRLLKNSPDDEAIRSEYRGILLWDDKHLSSAIVEYERLVEQDQTQFDSRRQLAVLLSKEPRRLRDSARWYAELVAEEPNDYALRHDYAKVLARIDGERQNAREQYALLVRKRASYTVLGEYAGLLAAERSTRADAIGVYSQMLERRPQDTTVRLRRAALYMAKQETASDALRDYKRALVAEPRNAEAHRGAAQAYAWLGESDRALYHSRLAVEYGDTRDKSTALRRELSEGREPRVSALFRVPWQTGDEFELRGIVLGALLSGELSPFLTARGAFGTERYEGEDDDASGSWYRLGAQYRIDSRRRFDLELGQRTVRRVGSSRNLHVHYTDETNPDYAYTAGILQEAVGDSFQSLVGDDETDLGGATRREAYLSYVFERDPYTWTLRPAIGQIEASSESDNSYFRVDGSVVVPVDFKKTFATDVGYEAAIASYDRDHSGFAASDSEPLSGGYFSPQFLLDQLPFVGVGYRLSDDAELKAKVGLRFQYVDDASNSGGTSSGLAGSVSYTRKTTPTRYLVLSAEHDTIGDRYERSQLQGQMVFVF